MRTASILLALVVVLGTQLLLGPLGNLKVPFTATQGLVGFCCIVATLITLPVVLTMRWKRKQPQRL
jgi:hypothetical protein